MLRRFKVRYCKYFVAAFVAVFAQLLNLAAQESPTVPSSFRFDDPMSFIRITGDEELQRAVSDFGRGSDFRRIMLIDTLKERLGDENPIILRGNTGNVGFDLKKVGGRARWLIEQVLRQENGNTNFSVDERIKLWKEAAAQKHPVTEQAVRELKEKYRGSIHLFGVKANASIEAMDRFLDDWFPYGKRIVELEEITGIRLDLGSQEVVLRIDSGYGGYEYKFRLISGVIESVIKEGIN
jgi:hypothetical protein